MKTMIPIKSRNTYLRNCLIWDMNLRSLALSNALG